ncbi:hypothetical protein C6P45_001692 [Maudiozyma exigua]|uniref:Cyclin-domain-containing protein n=1 Tax=Maudiozyma exigua TaxID=34358 RepID=A0A9P6W1P0_MAUEX|nr:hypothetical protein C6P45_001692 [Kazachstania exigua]
MSSIISSTTSIRNTPTQFSYDSETVNQNNANTTNVINSTANHRNNNDRQHSNTSVEAINGTTSVVTTKISTDDTLSSSPSSSYTSNNYTNSNNTNVQVSTNISGIRSNDNNNKKITVIQTPKKEQEKETISPTQVKWGSEQIIKDDNLTKENANSNDNNNNNNNNNNNSNNNNIDEKSDTIEPDFDYKFDSQKIVTLSTDKLIQMLTALLEKIINSNDRLNHNNGSSLDLINNNDPETNSLINSIVSFKGKHVPQIGLEQYFHRIQKYCPTTNDVFLSLLIYFDRISKKCNSKLQDAIITNEKQEEPSDHEQNHLDNNSLVETEDKELLRNGEKCIEDHVPTTTNDTDNNQQQTFVMDSYNIHRLIIAGITVSTKFFSDFFYSNSRYARVGGISLKEMNHLELQFLVLCDFEMLISVEEMERYANLLYRFWDSDNNNNASSNTD